MGGAERRFLRLFDYLRRRDCDVYLCTSSSGIKACGLLGIELQSEFTHVLRDSSRKRVHLYLSVIREAFEIAAWTRRKQIGHLHFGQNPNALTFIYSLLSAFSCPFSISLVDPVKDYQRNWREKLYARVSARFCKRIDCLSKQIRSDFCDFVGAKYAHKFKVAPCSFTDPRGVDTSVIKDVDIVLLGRMIPWKGHALLRDALLILEREGHRNLVVHVCGSGPLEDQIRADFATIKDQQLHIHYVQDPFQILLRTRIFVSLQSVENYPSQSLLEAMTCSCAIVATDVGLTRLLIDEASGILIPAEAGALAQALDRLINDPASRKALGAAANRVVTTQQTIERFAEYFVNEILGTCGADRRIAADSQRNPNDDRDDEGQTC